MRDSRVNRHSDSRAGLRGEDKLPPEFFTFIV